MVYKNIVDNDIDMYSTHNKGRSIVAERFIRILKNNAYISLFSMGFLMYVENMGWMVVKTTPSPPPHGNFSLRKDRQLKFGTIVALYKYFEKIK